MKVLGLLGALALALPLAAGCGDSGNTGSGGTGGDSGDLMLTLPDIVGTSAIVMVPETGLVIGSLNPDDRYDAFGTTQMLAAIVVDDALEAGTVSLDDMVTVTESSLEGTVGTFVMGLVVGDRVSVEDLMHGLLLPGTSDATFLLTEHVSGSREAFVAAMDAKAAELGLDDSLFSTPSGLVPADCAGGNFELPECANYSTARDLAVLGEFMMARPLLAQMSGTKEHMTTSWVNAAEMPKNSTLCNNSNLLAATEGCASSTPYEGANGVQTGTNWTLEGSIVARATRDGKTIMVVVQGSQAFDPAGNRATDAATLLDFGFVNAP